MVGVVEVAVDEQDVEVAIILDIEQRAAGAGRFRNEVHADGAALVRRVESGVSRDVGEPWRRVRGLG